jgi:hypothetical protein
MQGRDSLCFPGEKCSMLIYKVKNVCQLFKLFRIIRSLQSFFRSTNSSYKNDNTFYLYAHGGGGGGKNVNPKNKC